MRGQNNAVIRTLGDPNRVVTDDRFDEAFALAYREHATDAQWREGGVREHDLSMRVTIDLSRGSIEGVVVKDNLTSTPAADFGNVGFASGGRSGAGRNQ